MGRRKKADVAPAPVVEPVKTVDQWVEECKGKWGVDPAGFRTALKTLPIKRKIGGIGTLGELANPVQTKFWDYILEKRRKQQPVRRIQVKIRQLASFSTAVGAAIWGDLLSNGEGMDALITAHRPDSIMTLSRMYRRFAGGEKVKGGAKRLSDDLIQAPNGGYVVIQSADKELGRSESITHAHISEADYIEHFNDAMDSFMPAMSDAWWSIVVFETTMRQGISSEFKDFVDAASRGDAKPWEVDFTAWWMLPECVLALDADGRHKMEQSANEYERFLRVRLNLSWEQIAWHRKQVFEKGRGRLESVQEMYPSTLDEALRVWNGAEFFYSDSLQWYGERVKEPVQRWLLGHDGIRDANDPRIYMGGKHLAVWAPPRVGSRYVIGADGADADMRADHDAGSECYLVVMDLHTGEMCAEWHGYANGHEFAVACWRAAQFYNHALVVPEANASAGMIDHLMNTCNYGNVYEREAFGAVNYRVAGVYGFHTSQQTRPMLVQRLQDNINRRCITIPSAYLLKQIVAFGKRGGRAQKRQMRGATADDGVMALGLCMFGHENAVSGAWAAKDGLETPVDDVLQYVQRDIEPAVDFLALFKDDDDRAARMKARAFFDRS